MSQDKRSYNNGELSAVNVMALKKKSKRVSQVQFKLGSTKVTLPVDGFLFTTESGHGFMSVQPVNAVIQSKSDGSFEAVAPKDVATAVSAVKAYRPKTATTKSTRETVEVPEELQKMLAQIPKGYKLGIGTDGKYKMVKGRERKKK